MPLVRRWWARQRQRRVAAVTLVAALVLAALPVTHWAEQKSTMDMTGVPVLASGDHWPIDADQPPARTALAGLGAAPEASTEPESDESDNTASGSAGPGQPPASGSIEVGSTVQLDGAATWGEAFARTDASYGPVHMFRVFYPGLPPSWPGSSADVANRTVSVSFKATPQEILSGEHDAALRGWFESMPADRDIYWTYHHEPENNIDRGEFTAAQYRDAWRHVAGLADGSNPRLYPTLVLMGWSLEPASGRDWRDYYPGADVISVLGWDIYNFDFRIDEYSEPSVLFDRAIEVSQAEGKPWGIAEFGGRRVAGDESGAQRAAWIAACADYLTSHSYPPRWVAWYDAEIGDGEQYGLVDEPSRAAWADFIRSQ